MNDINSKLYEMEPDLRSEKQNKLLLLSQTLLIFEQFINLLNIFSQKSQDKKSQNVCIITEQKWSLRINQTEYGIISRTSDQIKRDDDIQQILLENQNCMVIVLTSWIYLSQRTFTDQFTNFLQLSSPHFMNTNNQICLIIFDLPIMGDLEIKQKIQDVGKLCFAESKQFLDQLLNQHNPSHLFIFFRTKENSINDKQLQNLIDMIGNHYKMNENHSQQQNIHQVQQNTQTNSRNSKSRIVAFIIIVVVVAVIIALVLLK